MTDPAVGRKNPKAKWSEDNSGQQSDGDAIVNTDGLAGLFSLAGRTAAITGGTGGIGSMIARGFLLAGAKVLITGRSEKAVEQMAQSLTNFGVCLPLVGDIGTARSRENLIQSITAVAPDLSIFVNNAGVSRTQALGQCTDDALDEVYEVNFKAGLMMIQGLLPILKANASVDRPAHIINIGSSAGFSTFMPGAYAYSPGKAAVHHLTKGLGRELAPHNIRVNAIAPGVFPTKMAKEITDNETIADQVRQMIPAGRWGDGDDIGALAIAIASNRYMVGNIIPIDGGLALGG